MTWAQNSGVTSKRARLDYYLAKNRTTDFLHSNCFQISLSECSASIISDGSFISDETFRRVYKYKWVSVDWFRKASSEFHFTGGRSAFQLLFEEWTTDCCLLTPSARREKLSGELLQGISETMIAHSQRDEEQSFSHFSITLSEKNAAGHLSYSWWRSKELAVYLFPSEILIFKAMKRVRRHVDWPNPRSIIRTARTRQVISAATLFRWYADYLQLSSYKTANGRQPMSDSTFSRMLLNVTAETKEEFTTLFLLHVLPNRALVMVSSLTSFAFHACSLHGNETENASAFWVRMLMSE